MGTLHYMAPEQLETPQDVDQRADIFSLGVVFYELLTGELPLGRFAPPSDKAPLDPRVDEVVMRALEKKREQRYQNVGEVKTEVEAITQSRTWGEAEAAGAAATLPPASKAPGLTRKTARFATLSAILTGISLLLGVTVVIMLFAVASVKPEPNQARFMGAYLGMLGALGFVIVSVPAFLGIIFGAKALGEIRQSGGRKAGFGSAMFGTLTWPVLLLIASIGLLSPPLAILTMRIFGHGVGPFVLCAIVVAIGGLAAVFLIRTVGRWALAIPRGAPSPIQLNAAISVFAVVVIALMGIPLLLSAMPDESHRPQREYESRTLRESAPATDSDSNPASEEGP
jgi:hypothetical protein